MLIRTLNKIITKEIHGDKELFRTILVKINYYGVLILS